MVKRRVVKKYLVFLMGLFFIALGIAFAKKSELGVTPISSVANVLSCKFTNLTFGTWMMIWNFFLIMLQILIQKKNFKRIELIQIPLAFVFGYFTDFAVWCISKIIVDSYIMKLLVVVCGVIIIGFGIALSVLSEAVMNSAEAFVKAVTDKTRGEFAKIKVTTDIANVAVSALLSLILFSGNIVGIREGTLIMAIFTGSAIRGFLSLLKTPVKRFIS